ncbi:putative ribosomally synthesized peptide with SipW-like signal peptide [Lachnospiraceae bacterium PF1-21]
MSKKKKIVSLVVAVALIAAIGIGATLAYLSATAGTVENTFTVGKIQMTLDEADVNPDGTVIEDAKRVLANDYHMIPGRVGVKDPTVTILAGSEKAYAYVNVTGVDALKAAFEDGLFNILYGANDTAGINPEWVKISGGNGIDGVYRFKSGDDAIVDASAAAKPLTAVFDKVKLDGTSNGKPEIVAGKSMPQITVDAFAIQSEYNTQAAADEEALDHFGF